MPPPLPKPIQFVFVSQDAPMTKVWRKPSIDTRDIAETYSLERTDGRTDARTDESKPQRPALIAAQA